MSVSIAGAAGPGAETAATESAAGLFGEVLVNDARPLSAIRYLARVWACRGLVMVLARKDFYVRYRRSWLGLFWALLVPLLQASVLAVVFSRLGRFSAGMPHYPVYVFSGFMVWAFFSSSLVAGSTAIVDGKDLADRIYFPRSVLPLVKLVTDLFTLATSAVILVALSLLFGVHLGASILLLFPAALLLMALTLGFTLLLSGLYVHFRDVRFILAAVVLPWFYLTPVFYGPQQLRGVLRDVVAANPVSGVLDAFRAATVGAGPQWHTSLPVSAAVAAVFLLGGIEVQRRLDRTAIDKL